MRKLSGEIMENDYINVGMNEIKITDNENTVIGTNALATCVGVILYSEKHKRAIVGHIANESELNFIKMIYMLEMNGFTDSKINYAVIGGYYYNHYELCSKLYNLFNKYKETFIPLEYNNDDILKDEGLPSVGFIFDASTGKFINSKNNIRHI